VPEENISLRNFFQDNINKLYPRNRIQHRLSSQTGISSSAEPRYLRKKLTGVRFLYWAQCENYGNASYFKSEGFKTFWRKYTKIMGNKFASSSFEDILVHCPFVFGARRKSFSTTIIYQSTTEISYSGFLSHNSSHSNLHSEPLADHLQSEYKVRESLFSRNGSFSTFTIVW
jgi:hypothetical protein